MPARLLLLLALATTTALAAPETPRPLEDPLTGGKSAAAREVVGGRFGPEGWTAVEETDLLHFELPAGARSGTLEFEIKGSIVGAPKDPRKHVFILSDRYLGAKAYHPGTTATALTLRIWSAERDGSPPGKTRLRAIGAAFGDLARARAQKDSAALSWPADRWHRLRFRWTPEQATFERDGELISTVTYPNKGVEFRHLLLNSGNYSPDMHGLIGVTYRNLKI